MKVTAKEIQDELRIAKCEIRKQCKGREIQIQDYYLLFDASYVTIVVPYLVDGYLHDFRTVGLGLGR